MITPNGRFQTDTRLCLSMSDFHPGTWNPSWSVATILNGLLSFMVRKTSDPQKCGTFLIFFDSTLANVYFHFIAQSQDESTTGSINTSYYERQVLALRSHAFNMNNARFRGKYDKNEMTQLQRELWFPKHFLSLPPFPPYLLDIFPELVAPGQVPLHIAYPNAPVTEMPAPAVPTLNALAPNLLAAAAVTATQRRMNAAAGGDPGVIGQRGATGPGGAVAGVGGGAAARQDSFFSWSRWHKWLAIFLLFAYLLVAKTINRASSPSGYPN